MTDTRFRRLVESRRLDAAIEAGQRKEREHRREYRSDLHDTMTSLKRDLIRDLDDCPFPPDPGIQFLLSASAVKTRWQRTLDAIDPQADNGEARLKQFLVQVQEYRSAEDPYRARPFAFDDSTASGPTFAERKHLHEMLGFFESKLELLVMYAKWWQTA